MSDHPVLSWLGFNFMNGSRALSTRVESDWGVRFTPLFSRVSGHRGYYEATQRPQCQKVMKRKENSVISAWRGFGFGTNFDGRLYGHFPRSDLVMGIGDTASPPKKKSQVRKACRPQACNIITLTDTCNMKMHSRRSMSAQVHKASTCKGLTQRW